MDRIPKPGEFYRHFKNKMYQVLTVAIHSETGERMVVYQALYGDYSVYARPLSMFVEEVDRQKYPDAAQIYRFEPVTPGADCTVAGKEPVKGETAGYEDGVTDEETFVHPLLLQFLDAEAYEEKHKLLMVMKGKVGQREADSLYVCLDVSPRQGTVEEQLEYLAQCLEMQEKFDASRLRR